MCIWKLGYHSNSMNRTSIRKGQKRQISGLKCHNLPIFFGVNLFNFTPYNSIQFAKWPGSSVRIWEFFYLLSLSSSAFVRK